MGSDIHIFREVRVGTHWLCCEPTYKNSTNDEYESSMPEDSAKAIVGDRWYTLFTILAEVRGMMGSCMSVVEFPNRKTIGVPDDASEQVKLHMDYITTEKDNCVHSIYNLTIGEIRAYLKHYHDEMLLTGNLPSDIVDADDESTEAFKLIDKFDNGCFKGTPYETDKRMQLYEYIWNNYNPVIEFLTKLDLEPCTGEFVGNFGEVNANDRRIIMYFDN